VFPDSNIFLHFIFNEEEFRPKIEYFTKMIEKGIRCEVLPQVTVEIAKKLFVATDEYGKTVRRCKSLLRRTVGTPLTNVFVNKEMAENIRKVFITIFNEISRKHFPKFQMKVKAIRRARIVETSVMLELWSAITTSQRITIKSFFDKLEDIFRDKYIEFCDKQSLFMKKLNSEPIHEKDLPKTTDKLREMIIKCGVHNRKDVIVICQAISRMYSTNRWCAVVTTDYGDMIKNQDVIDQITQLTISDPLYFIYRFDKKIDYALHPKQAATKMKIPFSTFTKSPTPTGVI